MNSWASLKEQLVKHEKEIYENKELVVACIYDEKGREPIVAFHTGYGLITVSTKCIMII
jgi:hypothetical protein